MGALLLIVDDNEKSAKLARIVLEEEGFEVVTVADAAGTRAALAERLPALILMDVRLPGGVDGLTLTRELKADSRYAAIPIVALTSHAMKGDDERARGAGCDAYVTKPFDVAALPALVARLVGDR